MSWRNYYNEGVYHIYNRGTDKRDIFLDDEDCKRFLLSLNTFNDHSNLFRQNRKFTWNIATDPFVEILSFTLMPNHFHLMIRQTRDGGSSKLMQRLFDGYTKYFNRKYKRSGTLFESKHKSKHVNNDAYYTHLTRYIHLNPLDLIGIPWKTEGLKNHQNQTLDFLLKYQWSSAADYLGNKNFKFLTLDIAHSFKKDQYKDFLLSYQPSQNMDIQRPYFS